MYLHLENVPTEKIPSVKAKLAEALARIASEGNVDMKRMNTIIERQKRELTSSFESNPHSSMAHILIGHVLYGNTEEDVSLTRPFLLLYFNILFLTVTSTYKSPGRSG